MAMDLPAESPAGGDSPPAEAAPPEEREERLRVYSGFGRLIVEDVDESKDEIARIAEANDGYVESVWSNVIIIRVPARLFSSLFKEILSLGEVDFKREETVDVTDFFTDLSSRRDIAEKTRRRLYALLEKTEDVEERLKILREIRRLTEEIERISTTLRSLEKQIAFSRIHIELHPRLSEEEVFRQGIPFPWIANLNPLYAGLGVLKRQVEVPLDDTYAVFSRDDIFRAENTRGVRIRFSRTDNRPQGDTAFWQKALVFHLSPLYAEAEPVEFQNGFLKGVLLTSKDTEPFHYLVVQRTGAEDIIVGEAFFPDSAELENSREAVWEAFEGVMLP